MYDATIIQPIIQGSHPYSYVYADKHPNLPLPITFEAWRPSIKPAYCFILETDTNRPWNTSFPHYIDCPLKQPTMIPIPQLCHSAWIFQSQYPRVFVMNFCEGLKEKDMVRLGDAGPQQAVVEGVEEFRKYFVRYGIHEVSIIPLESNMTTQLVAPLSNYQPFPFQLLAIIYVTLFSFFV
jgi:hypothetical protein